MGREREEEAKPGDLPKRSDEPFLRGLGNETISYGVRLAAAFLGQEARLPAGLDDACRFAAAPLEMRAFFRLPKTNT